MDFVKFNNQQEAIDWVKSGQYKFHLKSRKKELRRLIRKAKGESIQWVCQGVREKPSLYVSMWVSGEIDRVNLIVDWVQGVKAKPGYKWVWENRTNGDAYQVEDLTLANENSPIYKDWLIQRGVNHSEEVLKIWQNRNKDLSSLFKSVYFKIAEDMFEGVKLSK